MKIYALLPRLRFLAQECLRIKKINRRLDKKIRDLGAFELSKNFNNESIDELSRTMKFALLGQLFVNRFLFLFKEGGRQEYWFNLDFKYKPGT